MAKLNPNQRIYDVMGEIKRGTYRIPNIQRGFEWNKPRVLKLLDSIMHGYPIGAIMVWNPTPEIQADISDREFVPDFRSDQDYVTDAPHASDKESYLVLDGQQRLQSLYLSFFGSYDGERVYLAIDYEPNADDGDYGFTFLTPDQAKQKPNMLPLATIVELESETKSKFAKNLAQKLTADITDPAERQSAESEEWEKMICNIDRFIERFNIREVLLLQEVSSRQTYDHILEIFERVNSGGMVLSKSDLLFSTLKLKLREKEAEFKDTLVAINHGSRYAFDTDFLIKTSLVVLGKGAKYDVKKLKDNDYIARLKQHYPTLDKCLQQIIVWLDETALIKCDRFLPSRLAIIPLVDYMFLAGRHEKPDGPNSEAMKQYIHMAFFTRLFGRAGDTVLDRIHKELVVSINGDPQQGIAPEDNFPLPRLQRIIQDATNAPYALYPRFFSDDPDLMLNIVQGGQLQIDPADPQKHSKDLKLEVDHIFPRSRLRDANMADVADHIGNYRLVVLPINRRKTNHWPDAETNFSGREDASVSTLYNQALAKFDRDIYLQFEFSRAAFIRRRVEEFLSLKTGEQNALPLPPSESPVPSTPSPHTPEADASIEEVCQAADAAGTGKECRMFCAAGLRYGLYPRIWKTSVMFTPPQARNRMIFTAWTKPWHKKMRVFLSAEALAEFYPISIQEAARAIGQEGFRPVDAQELSKVLQTYDTLFSGFQGRIREPQTKALSGTQSPAPGTHVAEGPGIYGVNTNSRANPDAWRQMLAGSKAAAYYDRKETVANIPAGSVIYLYHTGTGVIAKGITTDTCKKADFDGDPDEEFYVPLAMEWKLDDPNTWGRAVTASEIKDKMNAYHPFRGTRFTISPEMAAAIDELWKGKRTPPSSTP
jgi:hypothetical protein